MEISKLIVIAISAASLTLGGAVARAKDWKVVRIGAEESYPPFSEVKPDGSLAGFDIDIANALCAQMKVKCIFVKQDWAGMIPALLAGKFDAIVASMSITPDREKTITFTDKYYDTPSAIAVSKDSRIKVPISGATLDAAALDKALKGKLLGAQTSTTHADYARVHLPDARLKLYPSIDGYESDLSSGSLDAAIDDVLLLSRWLKSKGGECCRLLGTLKIDPRINGAGVGIGLRKSDTDLKKMFNEAIAAIRRNGVYRKINDSYFDFDIYGSGDTNG